MKVIGFANQYWTLWNFVNTESYNPAIGMMVKIPSYTYQQNLSLDLNEAIAKVEKMFPNSEIEVDEHMRGEGSWRKGDGTRTNTGSLVPFGKYAWCKAEQVPVNYLKWMLEKGTGLNDEFKEAARKVLIDSGEYVLEGNVIVSVKWKKAQEERKQGVGHHFNDGDRVTVNVVEEFSKFFDNNFGGSYLVVLKDTETGAKYTYWGKAECICYRGAKSWDSYDLTFTVEHSEFKGQPQTKIKRPRQA